MVQNLNPDAVSQSNAAFTELFERHAEAVWNYAYRLTARDPEAVPGSNAFALAGTLTASGAGMLANDMHLDHGVPNIWYRAALQWPNVADASTPNQLIYTRQIVEPLGGVKVTGKLGRYSVAYLSALDETRGPDALFNVARARADFGGNSLLGASVTDRRYGGSFNTVAAADVRYVFGRLYYFEGQAGGSWTHDSTSLDTRTAPLWHAELDRTGRSWGFNYALNGIEDDFRSRAGFVPRSGIVDGHFFNRFSLYGGRGALIENFTFFGGPSRTWQYRAFPHRSPIEGGEQLGGYTIFRPWTDLMQSIEKPFICAVNGYCIGGGWHLDRAAFHRHHECFRRDDRPSARFQSLRARLVCSLRQAQSLCRAQSGPIEHRR